MQLQRDGAVGHGKAQHLQRVQPLQPHRPGAPAQAAQVEVDEHGQIGEDQPIIAVAVEGTVVVQALLLGPRSPPGRVLQGAHVHPCQEGVVDDLQRVAGVGRRQPDGEAVEAARGHERGEVERSEVGVVLEGEGSFEGAERGEAEDLQLGADRHQAAGGRPVDLDDGVEAEVGAELPADLGEHGHVHRGHLAAERERAGRSGRGRAR